MATAVNINKSVSIEEVFKKHPCFKKYKYLESLQTIKPDLDVFRKMMKLKINDLVNDTWVVFYRVKPPTMEEFLTPEWIGATAENLFPHVIKTLTEFANPFNYKRHLILASSIGSGKSLMSSICSLYVTVVLWCMFDPKKSYQLSEATSIVHALISFTQDKAKQLLLAPFMNILLSSPKFIRVKQEEHLTDNQVANPNSICFTTAGKIGVLQFYGDIHYMLASDPANLLGLNMVGGIMSELSFFLDKGFSADYINRIYNDTKGRVRSRFENRYPSYTIIDSSPNDMSASPIDKYIFSGKAKEDPENYVLTGAQWELMPHKYLDLDNTFPIFRGNAGQPPKFINSEEEIKEYNPEDIVQVPQSLRKEFESNMLKAVKDYAGYPSGGSGRLVQDHRVIENMFFPRIKNLYSYITAPDTATAKRLIWDQISRTFFLNHNGKYEFYRAPNAPRFLHIDQSVSGDMTGIACVHAELHPNGSLIYVIDFTINIAPKGGRINLEAIRHFILELRDVGNLRIELVTFDQFQSESTVQFLQSKHFFVKKLSVDSSMGAYLTLVTLLNTGAIKSGRNIFLKNNIKSLQEITLDSGKKKIDHIHGKLVIDDDGDWDMSLMGINAKDCSDAVAGAIFSCLNEQVGIPTAVWTPLIDEADEEEVSNIIKLQVQEQLLAKYDLKVIG